MLFPTSYDRILAPILWLRVFRATLANRADITIISGFDRPEHWVQAVLLWVLGRRRAMFCDSTGFDRSRTMPKRIAKRLFFAMVPYSLSYGERARAYVIDHGVRPERALRRCQAAYLPPSYAAATIPALRGEQAPAADAPVFLYVGRLSAEKDLDTLLRSFERVARAVAGARLKLVGGGPDQARLVAMAAQLECAVRVEFAGSRSGDALRGEYLAATALVLPSRSEPWGLVVNEALHFGCPVVVSDRCGCVPELVEGSDCGIVFPCGDAETLSAALLEVAEQGRDSESMARRCLAKIAPFSSQAAAEQIYAAIETIMAGR